MSFTNRRIAFAGTLAAVYAAVTLLTASFAYGPVQFRIAEALSVFCCFTPTAVVGMFIGCMAANLASTVSPMDIVVGSFATLLAGLITWAMSRRIEEKRSLVWLVPLPTVLCNAVLVGAEIAVFSDEQAFLPGWLANGLSVGAGEAAVLYALGVPLLFYLLKNAGLVRELRER